MARTASGRNPPRAANPPREQPARETREERPRKSTRKEKETASTSGPPPVPSGPARVPSEDDPEITTFPWPRPDNTPFDGVMYGGRFQVPVIPRTTLRKVQSRTEYQNYRVGQPWATHHCTFYNGLLRVEMAPTRFIDELTLQKMGIKSEVRAMLRRMGLGAIAYQTYSLYPELVRQFLASAELRYRDIAIPIASEGTLSFFSSGVLYEITIQELCGIYGFEVTPERCRFPTDFEHVTQLWSLIGLGGFESREAKLTHIRNPAIRVVAKILGNILFAKDESGALRKDELMLLHFGLPEFVEGIYSSPPPETLGTNLGAIFAENLVSKKVRGLNTVNKKVERIGSLLTPIFMHCGIDLSSATCEAGQSFFDETYFRNSSILKPGYIYQFQDRTGVLQYCKLPLRDRTSLTSLENIEFQLAPEHLHQYHPTTRQRGSSSRAATSQPHLEDDRVPSYFPQHTQGTDGTEFILPPYTGEYDLPPLPAEATEAERWMFESHRRTHSMMERIWGALAKIRCRRPPSCFRAAETREDRHTAQVPDVAGHRAAGADEDDESSDSEARLPRRRRQPGQSRSVSPEGP